MFSKYYLKYRFKFHFQFYRSVNSSGNLLWVFKNRALFWHYIISITFYLIKIYARLINEPSKIDIWWLFETIFIDWDFASMSFNETLKHVLVIFIFYAMNLIFYLIKVALFYYQFFTSLDKIQQIYDWLEYVKSNL